MTQVQQTRAGDLDLEALGRTTPPYEVAWTSRDALLYAVGVGAGQEDPATELSFTTENSRDVPQEVLPTFLVIHGMGGMPPIGNVELSQILHAEQAVTLHAVVPPAGRARGITEVTGIYDKGKGALVRVRTNLRDADSEQLLATLESGIFVRGAGGFGGDRGPSVEWSAPDRKPDTTVSYETAPNQALIYRLSGDRNPLHSDPAVATAVGFPRPILHGLCTYGFTGRALLAAVCEGDSSRFGTISARFSAPVLPGQRLDVAVWKEDGGALFRSSTEAGVVLDHGRFALR